MSRALRMLATLAFGSLLWAEGSGRYLAPSYSSASIVNSATNAPGALAPNTLATIYGSNLSYSTRAVAQNDIRNGALPNTLGGVRVFVAGIAANLYFVSPQQINFLIPPLLRPGEMDAYILREGISGPFVRITLLEAAPALFQATPETVIGTHADGKLITMEAPAQPGETIVLYAAGLGRTNPDITDGRIPTLPFPLQRLSELRVLIAGESLDPARILYAGVTPGFAGLYQINLRMPDQFSADPEIRVSVGEQISPSALKLPAR